MLRVLEIGAQPADVAGFFFGCALGWNTTTGQFHFFVVTPEDPLTDLEGELDALHQ